MASGKQSFREHSATKILLEANPRNISASKISRYTVFIMILHENIVNLVVHLWSFTDEILRDAIDNDIAFLVVGDPLGYVKHYTYLLFSIIIVIVS